MNSDIRVIYLPTSSFIGTLIKQRGFVAAYGMGLIIHLCISLASGIFALVALFKQDPQQAIKECLNGATDLASKDICKSGVAMTKAIAVVIYVIMWLLQICMLQLFHCSYTPLTFSLDAYIIVSNYVDQLDEEESVQETRQIIQTVSQPAPVNTYASFTVPPQGPAAYAFTQGNQSHGVRGNNSVV